MNVWLPKGPAPNVYVSVLFGESGSPQLMSRVNVSCVPGSVIVPVRVATPCSLIAATGSSTSSGATLLTVTESGGRP